MVNAHSDLTEDLEAMKLDLVAESCRVSWKT